MDDILVSVGVITYNQEKYIKQCLDSILNQKTNFKFEIILNDDCSTDRTIEIIKEYEAKYPDIIKPVYQAENQYSKGKVIITNFIFPRINTKYFAFCDGDDYWTDPYKLQKQVDFLETHPDYSVCFHKMKMIYENSNKKPDILPIKMSKNPQSFRKLLQGGYIPSNSIMYRFEYMKQELKNYPDFIFPPDWFNHIIVASHGKIGFINEVMSVYRRNEQSITFNNSDNHEKELHKKFGIREMNFFYEIWQRVKDTYPEYYKEMFLPKLRDIYFTFLQLGDFEKLEILKDKYSDYFKDMESSTGIASKKHKKYKKMFTVSLIINIVLAVFLLGSALLYMLKFV